MANRKTNAEMLRQYFLTATSLLGVLPVIKDLIEPTKEALGYLSPEITARLKRHEQKDKNGPVDEKGYINTKQELCRYRW